MCTSRAGPRDAMANGDITMLRRMYAHDNSNIFGQSFPFVVKDVQAKH